MNDLNEASMGTALLRKLGGGAVGKMSVKDIMKQQQFTKDLITRVAANLDQGIRSGLINPDPNAKSEQGPSVAQGEKPAAPAAPAAAKPAAPAAAKPAAPAAAPAAAKPAAPTAQTPAQVRQQKQTAAAQTAQAQMKANAAKPAATPTAPGTDPRAAGAKSRQRLQQRALNRATKESKFNKLDAIFENLVSLDEQGQQYGYTISSYLENFMKKYLGGVDTTSLKPMIDAVQSTYSRDKGKKALNQLAQSAYSLYWTGGAGQAGDKAAGPQNATDAMLAGLKQGLGAKAGETDGAANAAGGQAGTTTGAVGNATGGQAGTTDATTGGQADAAAPAAGEQTSPEKVKTIYQQVKGELKTLNKQQKGYILKALQKELGTAAPAATSSQQGTGAFGQMATQLAAQPTASSTGGTTTGVSGVGPGVVRHTAGKGTKVKQAKATRTKQAAPTKIKKASPLPVAESTQYKVWGAK